MYLIALLTLIRPLIAIQLDGNRPLLQEITLPKNLNENQTIKLNCDLLQGSQVEFIWYFNNEKLAENSRKRIKSNEETSYLVIKSLSVEDIGRYTCVAQSSEFESDRKDVDVLFNGQSLFSSVAFVPEHFQNPLTIASFIQ